MSSDCAKLGFVQHTRSDMAKISNKIEGANVGQYCGKRAYCGMLGVCLNTGLLSISSRKFCESDPT